jgi:hypothetical protein
VVETACAAEPGIELAELLVAGREFERLADDDPAGDSASERTAPLEQVLISGLSSPGW